MCCWASADAKIHIPIIFVTAYGDVSMSVRAMKAGAVDFLTKPRALATSPGSKSVVFEPQQCSRHNSVFWQ